MRIVPRFVRMPTGRRARIVISCLFAVLVCAFFISSHSIRDFLGRFSPLDFPKTHEVLAHYQFTPTHGTIVVGASTTISSVVAPAAEGANVGSWKGTTADDNYHWVVAGENPGGVDVNLTVGGVQLNGANKLIIQTEFDLDATVLSTEVQICDFVSSSNVDYAADDVCTGGGWRTLNTRNASQVPLALTHTSGTAFQWHIYNGYWSTGTTGGTAVNTPLSNFINGSNQIKVRYFSTTNTTTEIAIDYLRIYAIVDPVYHAGGFTQVSGNTPIGHYGNTFGVGNSASAQLAVITGDATYLDVAGTAATTSDFYFTFKNVKTYVGMNTILVNAETLCTGATSSPQYRFKIRNVTTDAWEDISQTLDCSTTGDFNNFALNNIVIDDYINGSDEIWVGIYALSTSTTYIRTDSIYLILGTTNTDANSCEISFGGNTAGRIATNPSVPGSDRIQAMTTDGTYLYVAGYDSFGIDNEWRIEKRTLSDGALVGGFGTSGATTTDPSTGIDQIFAIATTSGAFFVAGYDLAVGAGQWRIEKRDSTDGTLITAFDSDGILTANLAADVDQITAIAVDASSLYVTGYEDDDTGVWRTHKYDITSGALVTAFDGDGIATSTLAAAGDERPQAIKVDSDYLYVAGYDNIQGNAEWRIEKRNKTTGALCASGVECTAGAFGVGGVATTNPSANSDRAYALAIDDTYMYVAGHDGVLSATDGQWRIEKRNLSDGALVGAFGASGVIQDNPTTADIDWVTNIIIHDTYLYLSGFIDDDAGVWRIEKRDKTTGATTTEFSSNGVALSEDGGDDRPNALVLADGYLYAGGYGTAPGDNQWLIEKWSTSTGLRVNDDFGANDCTDTRDIDITGDNRNAWVIQTQDESATFGSTYYPYDNDFDAVLEEAGSANIDFSVSVPENAAVAGIYWAGHAMSGPAGTVRLALKDYSGLTSITGGRTIVGSAITTAMLYNDPLTTTGIGSGGLAGYMTNPEDYVDTVNNRINLALITNVAGASTTNSVNTWDFAMVSFSWVEDVDHPSSVYQFTPTHGTIVVGASTTISSVVAPAAEGANVGSWKGTTADDNYHWVVAGENPGGVDVNLTVGGVQLNGANKLIIQTEFDLDATVLSTEVQICDFVSSSNVDYAADDVCTGGGWRTLNTRNASQVPLALTHTSGTAFQWHIYNGYWSTGTTGGTAVNTPLSNFINGSNQIKVRYFSTTNTTTEIAIDYLRIYAIVDPVYHAGGFTQVSGNTPIGHYGNTFGVGNSASAQLAVITGDATYLDVAGTAATTSDFYFTFKNVKTYVGMNTILVNAETLCTGATSSPQYRFKIRNVTTDAWEDISQTLDCSTTGDFNNFALNNIVIDDYINGSDEIWVGIYALSTSTTYIRTDSIYLILGTTNTDANSCEISFGGNTAGRIATNPSVPGSDRIQAMTTDGTYLYVAGYDSFGIDNEWRIEKRTLSDGALVGGFGTSGATTTDPSTGIDQIFAIATTSGAFFVAGYDLAVGAGQWRIEKRDSTDGTLITAFDSDGILTANLAADVDQITAIAVDASSLYVTGYEDDDTGVWRTHKYDITSGALVTAFDGDGIATSTLAAAGDERPQAIKVDSDYLYVAGYDNIQGNAEWRIEKRNKTTGALCASGVECTAGAFGVGGVATTNPSANSDRAYALAIDDTYMYVAGHDGVLSATDGQWRIEKRNLSDGALVGAFGASGVIQDNPTTADIDWVTNIIIHDTYLYLSGFIDDDAGVWRIEKRDKTTGATTTEFSSNGVALSEDGGDDRPNALVLADGYLYAGGYGTAPGDNQWLIEKWSTSTGLRVNDDFGANDCTDTRDIDITGDNRNAWVIQTQDESATFGSTYYPYDNDFDAVLEEAGSANIDFSVSVPENAAVAGIYWAGHAMSGPAGTVRLALKDYSGLTSITGGRTIVGSAITTAMLYNDPLTTTGIGSGGLAGYMTNPEDYVDTVNNRINLALITNVAGASTTNSVNTWDFAMVSFSWVEATATPVYSISITSDGVIQYGYLNLNTSSSTVGGDTQTVQNTSMVSEKINVRSGNALGGVSWLLGGSTASNQYTHEFSTTTGASWSAMPDSSTYVLADPIVLSSETVDFDFRITAPLGTTDFTEKSITITIQAVAP